MKKRLNKQSAPDFDIEQEVGELQVLLRALGEEMMMMRDAGKLAEKEKTYSGDIVTEADTLIEREIIKRIQSRHPEHAIQGEESGESGPSASEYRWIVNPIDGTKNFSKGLDFFSIAIALKHKERVIMGITYFPQLSRFIYAIKGKGAYENGKPFKVFERPIAKEMRNALIAGATTTTKKGRFPILEILRMRSMNLLNMGSMTHNCILLAERKLDAAVHTDATLFSIAAAIPILEETGCVVSGFEKDYPDLDSGRIQIIFAANRSLLEDIKKNILPQWKLAEK